MIKKERPATMYDDMDPETLKESMEVVLNYSRFYETDSKSMAVQHVKDLQQFIDTEATGTVMQGVSCKKGCCHCCYINVDISQAEAIILLPHVKPEQKEILRRQANARNFNQLPYQDRKCIFLKKGECSVYADRPLACRKYFVVNDPEKCDTSVKIQVTQVMSINSVALRTDGYFLVHHSDNLAKQICKLKKW